MTAADKTRNIAQGTKGKVKEAVGKVTGDAKLERKGKIDQTKADVKQAGAKLKSAVKH